MSSLSNINSFSRSMNGLNNINANSIDTSNLDVDTLIINSSGIAPTMPLIDNSTHIATTSFVQNVISGVGSGYVDLTSAQNITGTKTFIDVNVSSTLEANYISNLSSIDTPTIGSGLQTDPINIVSNQTSGVLNLGCRNNRTGNINIGTLTTNNAPIVIGSTASTTQTATHNAITTFNKIPSCSIAPTSGSHLTNKTYVDSVSGSGLLSSNNIWTGDNNFSGSVCIFGAGGSATGIDGLNVSVGSVATNNLYLSATTIQTLNTTNFTINPAVLFNLIPPGTIMTSLATSMTGYFLCDGTSLSTSIQPRLFAVIGYNYGGSGANFNLPDFRGAFLRGNGSQTVGGVTYTGGALSSAGRQQDAVLNPLYASNQGFRSCAAGARDCVSRDKIGADPVDINTGILPRFDRTTTENRPFNYSINYFIRY